MPPATTPEKPVEKTYAFQLAGDLTGCQFTDPETGKQVDLGKGEKHSTKSQRAARSLSELPFLKVASS